MTTLSTVIDLEELAKKFAHLDMNTLAERAESMNHLDSFNIQEQLILECLSYISIDEPDWTYVAANLYLKKIYHEASLNRNYAKESKYGGFYSLIVDLTNLEIYEKTILESYSQSEIQELGACICPERDELFTYLGLKMMTDRYLAKDRKKNIFELPQERFMIIAMVLMQKEQTNRLQLVKEAYWAMSNLYMTVATPTLSNAGKNWGQLSSCFIETVDDSLDSIYDSNTDIAALSKNGGGIGVYLGKIRSRGSEIKGFKGASSGVLPWMKQLNNTAVSVDQLGQRQGAISVYLDVWHKDIFSFLDAKLNNGDERLRTHDLFTGVCLPDLFMEAVENRQDWYLFDPHEVRQKMGYSLEDYFDETEGAGSFRQKYEECITNADLSMEVVPAIEIMKSLMRSQLETGTPFMFYRDEVNRKNANAHAGMIYCTNLCTEIVQNQSVTKRVEEYTKDGRIIIEKIPGDFVVCNLSSINLARSYNDNILERLVPIQVRMLDNVIDINSIPVLQGQLTNQKYRAIGLGTFGWHHLLATNKVIWESPESLDFADQIYEKIAYLTIKSSMELACEKGSYPAYSGSDWETGDYFAKRGYLEENSEFDWAGLMNDVQENGIRNGYLQAVAPNASTALIAGSTPSIDPIFNKQYSEEKKDYRIPVTAPDLNSQTTWYYKSAYHIDQKWSIEQNARRQKHIDQAISFNLYIKNNIKAKELLDLHLTAWKNKLKTTYYLRSTSTDIEDCESCSS
ncbi:ribonucleoside-diphosphate reductase alpha chain [Cytobacillus horneckiae]|uniref:Ribonucleoside-diphosphate reductase n=1 Tax=Cytobacillus horneckiae TaxID=549687 RepID=A0A2N0ZLF1_9BACI|nr:ribonucleoside-diphosphate reductase subunit alpha [Cytobacillus horneckiae]NRG46676.1 ribonucleoside-diphosphate reductase subunit alpha [Bacillus sp. CRN 9]MBN6885737.1 ribonucleoside-diphosphate reductase subunit alpha [Cytobacillus horneckiae]MCM3177284.1 ribonucleoside-diphosphate reductase subunit alpha [Cytobacillus horneckiae]MEC1156154.1 ribonucleoside-diphosphate reductase subunit alpha [Cytobacillus horneckiae]MED2937513.1 ribonucleoside-diphosphate reductase subunit alpha [Cytob